MGSTQSTCIPFYLAWYGTLLIFGLILRRTVKLSACVKNIVKLTKSFLALSHHLKFSAFHACCYSESIGKHLNDALSVVLFSSSFAIIHAI